MNSTHPPLLVQSPWCIRSAGGRIIFAALMLVAVLGAASAKDTLAPADGPRHHLVQGGQTVAMIVLPEKPDMLEGYAAGELQKYVKEITGNILPIVNEPELAEGFGDYNEPQKLSGYGIWLGTTKAAKVAKFTLTEAKLGRDGYAAQADDKGLVIVGRCPLGTIFGVYDLIEREFGVRWFVPDEQQRILTPDRRQLWEEQESLGEVVPKASELSIGTFRREFKPSFDQRWVREGDWALRNRMNVWTRVNGLPVGVNCKWYGHTFGGLIPAEKYFKDHPEWFPLVNGNRYGKIDPQRLGHDPQLCTSNPEVIEKVSQRLIETIVADPTIEAIALSPNDGGGFCECDKCKALDGTPRGDPTKAGRVPPWLYSNRFGIFHNEVARRVGQRFPKVIIKVFMYGFYHEPPDIKDYKLEPNLQVQVCLTPARPMVEQWAKLTANLGVYQHYAVAAWGRVGALRGMVHEMRDDIPWFRAAGVKSFFTQYMQQPWTQCPLNHYIAAKLVWNADLDVDWLIQDYCDKFFEHASAPMHSYLLAIEDVTQRYTKVGVPAYDQATRDKMRASLDAAKEAANSAVVGKRIAALRAAFDVCEKSMLDAGPDHKQRGVEYLPPTAPKPKASEPQATPAGNQTNAQSPSGLDYYSQGGVVVDGIAYFTANDSCHRRGHARTEDYPCVMAMDLQTHQVVRRYHFSFTYDSSPLVYPTKQGEWLVIAHEYKKARTLALKRDTGEVAWTSEANQPGTYFFGYSHYLRPDGSRLILMVAQNGLHAMSGDTGRDEWHVPVAAGGGVTPAVDQANGWIFYQTTGKVFKIDARTGAILKTVSVEVPMRCVVGNTVLTSDAHGSFVATYWTGPTDSNEWGSGIRVFDKNLNLVWEKTGIPGGKKATLTYADGKLVTGSGNQWNARYEGNDWKYIAALDIATGAEKWRCDLSQYKYTCILNVPHFNGCFYAETQDSKDMTPGVTSKVFRIDGATGKLEQVLDYGRDLSSCATSIIARGQLLSGDLVHDRLVVTELATGSKADWPGPFGDPQLNQMSLPHDPAASMIPMLEIKSSSAHPPSKKEK